MSELRWQLFEVFGIECEYMLVDAETFEIRSDVDEVLRAWTGRAGASDFVHNRVAWSNELVAHVIELKTDQPAVSLLDAAKCLQSSIAWAAPSLASMGLRLLPTAMHPWMNPVLETRLWPHENAEIYQTYDRIFNCRSHGWANLQSLHLNLPFADDDEFGRLHAAVRCVLPILPALAASSPVFDGRVGRWRDNRLAVLKTHCDAMPSLTGDMIPEPIFDEATYRREILGRCLADIAPLDPDGHLEGEFLNARGAIARFDRGSIEIRVIDVQECPTADVAIAAVTVEMLRRWVELDESFHQRQRAMSTSKLAAILWRVAEQGEDAIIDEADYLLSLGLPKSPTTAREVWRSLIEASVSPLPPKLAAPIAVILDQGTLSTRILRAIGPDPSRDRLRTVYQRLAACLVDGVSFTP